LKGGACIQPESLEIVLVRRGNPRRVIVQEGVHYFYWRLDLYRPFDYEPVKTCNDSEGLHVVTRYHWKGTVIWTSPKLKEGKPVLDFYQGPHTPLIITEKGWFALVCNFEELTLIEKKMLFHCYLPIIAGMLEGTIDTSIEQTHGYCDKIVHSAVPDKYVFFPNSWKFLIIVGELTDVKGLLQKYRNAS